MYMYVTLSFCIWQCEGKTFVSQCRYICTKWLSEKNWMYTYECYTVFAALVCLYASGYCDDLVAIALVKECVIRPAQSAV